MLTLKHILQALTSPVVKKSSINQGCLTIEPLFAEYLVTINSYNRVTDQSWEMLFCLIQNL